MLWNISVEVTKTVKSFLATHATFGGTIRVVIVKEPTGPQFFYGTDPDASVRDIIEALADRSTIEQVFHDVPCCVSRMTEIWGSGQQQVHNLWTNIGIWHLNLWQFTLTELWAWNQTAPATDAPHRLAVGHSRPSPVSRGSQQSPRKRRVC